MAPRFIYLIRHGEKPDPVDPSRPPFGVDANGTAEIHGLTPRGWQRAGALVALFAPASSDGPPPPVARPDRLIAASYGALHETQQHRPFLTVAPLSERLGVEVAVDLMIGQEADVTAAVLSADNRATLICWEHAHVPLIAARIPVEGAPVTNAWPDSRFDLVWCFERSADATHYTFREIGQWLLAGDAEP